MSVFKAFLAGMCRTGKGAHPALIHVPSCLAVPAAIKHLTGPWHVVVAWLSWREHGGMSAAGGSQQLKNVHLLELLLNHSSNRGDKKNN